MKNSESLTAIKLKYPGKTVSFIGFKIHWLILYLILVLIIVMALRKRFGVEFF